MFGFNAIQEAIGIALVVLILVLLVLLGAQYMEVKSLQEDNTNLTQNLATCKASNAQLEVGIAHQNKAVDDAKRDGDARVAAAQAAAARAVAGARKMAVDAARKAQAERDAKPDNPTDLCGSAQRSNAQFIKARQ